MMVCFDIVAFVNPDNPCWIEFCTFYSSNGNILRVMSCEPLVTFKCLQQFFV